MLTVCADHGPQTVPEGAFVTDPLEDHRYMVRLRERHHPDVGPAATPTCAAPACTDDAAVWYTPEEWRRVGAETADLGTDADVVRVVPGTVPREWADEPAVEGAETSEEATGTTEAD